MQLGEEFGEMDIAKLLDLPIIQVYQWIEYYKVKAIRAAKAQDRKKNGN